MGRVWDEEEEAELPEIRRQTPVNDGIQTSPKTPARLADGLEVEGPPPDPPAGYAPGEPRLAHWFPRSALEARIRLLRAYARHRSPSKVGIRYAGSGIRRFRIHDQRFRIHN